MNEINEPNKKYASTSITISICAIVIALCNLHFLTTKNQLSCEIDNIPEATPETRYIKMDTNGNMETGITVNGTNKCIYALTADGGLGIGMSLIGRGQIGIGTNNPGPMTKLVIDDTNLTFFINPTNKLIGWDFNFTQAVGHIETKFMKTISPTNEESRILDSDHYPKTEASVIRVTGCRNLSLEEYSGKPHRTTCVGKLALPLTDHEYDKSFLELDRLFTNKNALAGYILMGDGSRFNIASHGLTNSLQTNSLYFKGNVGISKSSTNMDYTIASFYNTNLIVRECQPLELFRISAPPRDDISFSSSNKVFLTIHCSDGRIELDENITTNEAARAFWKCVSECYPYMFPTNVIKGEVK